MDLLESSPSDTGGTIDVLDHLKQYVPTVEGTAVNIPCHGDGLTVECITKAKKARSVFRSSKHDLSCFTESAQEFHKEGINLEVCWCNYMYMYIVSSKLQAIFYKWLYQV